MRHFPSIEALTAAGDERLMAELEICQVLEKLARVRAFVDRADRLLSTVLACAEDETGEPVDPATQERVYAAILASLQK